MPPGEEREEMMRKAEDTELALRMTQWMSSPGLQPDSGTVGGAGAAEAFNGSPLLCSPEQKVTHG